MSTLIMKIPGSPVAGANLKKLPLPSVPLVSDGFNSDRADLNTTSTDNALGGSVVRTWQSNATAFRTLGGILRQATNNVSSTMGAGLNVGNANIRGTLALAGMPPNNINLDFRKAAIDNGTAASSCYRLRVTTAGLIELLRKPLTGSGQYDVVSTGTHLMRAPGTFGLEIKDRNLSIQIDGETVETWVEPNTLLSGNFFEIVVSSGFSINADYIKFETLI